MQSIPARTTAVVQSAEGGAVLHTTLHISQGSVSIQLASADKLGCNVFGREPWTGKSVRQPAFIYEAAASQAVGPRLPRPRMQSLIPMS